MVEIGNGSMRANEIHLGSFSELKPSSEVLKDVKTEKMVQQKTISEFRVSDNVSARAFIVQVFDPKFFTVCPECKKKAVSEGEGYKCAEHGKVIPDKRFLINIVLDDGTETIRSVLFQDAASGLGIEISEGEDFSYKKNKLLGREMIFSGDIRMNSYFNNPEFSVQSVKEVDYDSLIAELEKSH